MALSFDAAYYLQTRPDVFQNYVATAGKTGLTWEQFAQQHYNDHGRFEGSNPNAVFNTLEYLAANPDVAKAGVNPFNHYLSNGAAEDRAPSASFISFAAFSANYAASYLAANPDLAAAGITTPAKLYAHFVIFGEFENRAGAPAVNTGVVGSTVQLTTGVDTLTGTANNDTFVADNTAGAGKYVLSAADSVNGGAGVDTLKIFSDGNAAGIAALTTASITNVETIYVNNANGNAIDVSGIAGVTSVIDDAPGAAAAGTVTVKAQSVTFSNDTNGGATFTVASAATDTAQAVTVSKIGKSGTNDTIDLSGTKVASATLTSTGAANFVTLTDTGAALTSLTIKGDQALSLTESINGLKTIDASAASAAVSVNATGATIDSTFAFTGGVGADSLALKAGAVTLLKAGTQLDGGAGIDTLTVNDTTFAAADYTKLSAVKNFEVLGLGTTGATLDASQVLNFHEFAVSTGTETITNIQAGTTVDITGATTAVNLSSALGVSSLSVNLGTATTAGFTTTSLTTTGITNVTIKEAGTSAHTITALHNADNSNVVITGAADLTIGAIDATTTGSKIDASGVTGKFEVTGSSKADVLIGGSGVDTLHTGGGADTLTGNAGLDKFDVSASLNTGGTVDSTITDMVKGETLQFNAGLGTAAFTATAVNVTGAASLDAAVTLAAAGDGGTNSQIKWFQYNGDTYVVEDNTNGAYAAATDQVVKLVGVHDLSASTLSGVTLTHG